MRHIRKLGVAAVAATVLGAFAGGPSAHANTPEVFLGSATATALKLDLLEDSVTVGQALSKVSSKLEALAEGAAALTVLGSTTSRAELVGVTDGVKADPDTGVRCNPSPIDVAGLLTIANACTRSATEMINGLPHAVSQGTVDRIDLKLNTVLSAIPLGETLETVLQPVVDAVKGLGVIDLDPVVDTVTGVVNDVLQTQTVAITLGDAVTDTVAVGDTLSSVATAEGGRIDILPAPAMLNGAIEPLASVIIGSSRSEATYNRDLGKAVPSFDAALVTVKLAAIPALGFPGLEVPVKPGITQEFEVPGVLKLLVQVADGKTFELPDGTVGAEANAVRLALDLLGAPTIDLSIAGTQAMVAGQVPVIATPPNVPTSVAQLPRTGGVPVLPLIGGAVLVAAIMSRRALLATR